VGDSDPTNWDMPTGSDNFDVALLLMAPDHDRLEKKLAIGHAALAGLTGIHLAGRIDVAQPKTGREHFGYRDGISRPFIEGQPGNPLLGQGDPVKAGEFVLGYPNELGKTATGPGPEAFWRNGTY
jgi:deferrochelatase/peroxidase EfeB